MKPHDFVRHHNDNDCFLEATCFSGKVLLVSLSEGGLVIGVCLSKVFQPGLLHGGCIFVTATHGSGLMYGFRCVLYLYCTLVYLMFLRKRKP